MKSERDRDRTVELLLRRQPEGNGPSASDACAEADVLAAWVDGALLADEVAALEAHAADCARCQALLAVMARTEIPAVHRPWWRSAFSVRWLVPLAAAAAMMMVWVSVRPANQSMGVPTLDPADANRSRQAIPESQTPARVPEPAEPSVRALRQEAAPSRPKEEQSIAFADNAAKVSPPGAEQSKARDRGMLGDEIAVQGAAAPSSLARPVPPLPASPSAPPVGAPQAAAFGAGRGGGRGGAAADPPASAGAAERFALRASESVAQPPLVVSSPDPLVRWRPRPDGLVEHSTDGGRTWESQPTGTSAVAVAGASPSPTVCWLAGRAGVVLLSIDGRTWQRLSFPELADLVAIHATDARTATVTTSDGRTFSTSDGGVTWAKTPLQEFPSAPFYQ